MSTDHGAVVVAQLSDIHIGGSDRSVERARAVLRHLAAFPGRLDAIVVTGDVADHGLPEEYATAAELLGADVPVGVCPGNHDVRAEFERRLGPVGQVLRLDRLTVALADSTVPGHPHGELTDEVLGWLDTVLSERPDVPALVALHHPPVVLGIPYVDGIALREPKRLAALLDRHPHVAGVLAGHAHTAAVATFAGRPLAVAPGVVSTAWTETETADPVPMRYDLPPAFALHRLDGAHLVTHYRTLPEAGLEWHEP